MDSDTAIASRLLAHIAEICSLDLGKLSRDTRIHDIGLDSLSLPQILEALQTEFMIQLDDDAVAAILEAKSIGDYVDVLNDAVART